MKILRVRRTYGNGSEMRSKRERRKNVHQTRERHTRREHDERERERPERSAPDRGGGRTGNMAAGAPVPGIQKSISPSRHRLKRKIVRVRLADVNVV